MPTHSRLLFDHGVNAQKGRPNLNDLLFINTSFFNLFLPLLMTALMRFVPQANHLVFGELEGQDPIYSTLLIGFATLFHMLIYMRQTYFYERPVDRSKTFKIINQISFLLPISIWFLAIAINYPKAHPWSLLASTGLLVLISFSVSTKSKHNPFKTVLQESKINRLILLVLVSFGLIFIFFLIKFEEIPGQDRLAMWVLIFIVLTFIISFLINEYIRRKYHPRASIRQALFQNSTINAIYILLVLVTLIRFFGDPNTFGNGFDVLILYFLCLRILLFCFGVFIRYFVNAPPIRFFNFKFGTIVMACYILGFFSRPYPEKNPYSIDIVPKEHVRMSMDEYIVHWLNHTSSTAPIYLISGQGGGSRAGCAFFTTMALLDSMLDRNTLCLTTVSGSSNGAGFYLGIKKAIPHNKTFHQLLPIFTPNAIKKIDSILYQKDYISNSFFKLLFTDYIRSHIVQRVMTNSRNFAFMGEEKKSYLEVSDTLRLDPITFIDSTWSSIYHPGADPVFPLFIPMSYNIEKGLKAINSPVQLPIEGTHPHFSILDALGTQRDLKINRSILTSQMFPFISASGSIDQSHYLDGGVYDNLGYETLFDIYNLVAKKRDSMAQARPIILLSVINGNYEEPISPDRIHTQLDAVSHAVSQSMFSSNPVIHESEGLSRLNQAKDRFYELRIYPDKKTTPQLSIWEKAFDFFRYVPDKDKVIISRFLTMNEIENNIIQNAYREVDSLKVQLNRFLQSK